MQNTLEQYSERPIQRGDSLTLTVQKAAFEGRCTARINGDGLIVFVDGAVPGDTVEATVYRKKKQFAEARVERILVPSPHRVQAPCEHFGVCGGCSWQHMSYEQQCIWKREHVVDAFERLGGFRGVTVHETIPSEHAFWYRNKMEYSFGEMRWLSPDELGHVDRDAELFALGLHVPKRYDRILHIERCLLESEQSNEILRVTRSFFLQRNIPPYSTRTHEGDLRHLVIREGKHTGERMVFLVSTYHKPELMKEYAEVVAQPSLGVTTFVHGVTTRKSTVAIADEEIVYFGDGVIHERLGGNMFRISPTSFFQTNSLQAERLYAIVEKAANLRREDKVWDLYCGAGTITLYVARHASHVIGVELNMAAITDARRNAVENRISNVEFHCADISTFLAGTDMAPQLPDIVIVDPPRAGMHPSVVEALGKAGVARLVYVSCNPATSARDCATLREYGYEIIDITPVDMFPHTWHIECVISLLKTV